MTPSLTDAHQNNKTAAPHVTHASTSFTLFPHLPREIADQIILLACRLPPPKTSQHPHSPPSPLTLDTRTTLTLLLVSKSIHTLVLPLLYTAIRITRPSALLELLETLEERPELGERIRHLHVGDEDTLRCREGDWPLVMEDKGEDGGRVEEPALFLKTAWTLHDEGRLPRWCEPGKKWCLEQEARVGCTGAAVRGAIGKALEEVDVQPYRRGYSKKGEKIGVDRWAKRTFELQACLDLYLAEMRRIEDGSSSPQTPSHHVAHDEPDDPAVCRLGECGHYPILAISIAASSSSKESKKKKRSKEAKEAGRANVFAVTRHQIWTHLTRRGAVLDQFDHPVRWAKDGYHLGHITIAATSIIKPPLAGPHPSHFKPEQYDPRTAGAPESFPFPRSDFFEDEWPHAGKKGQSSGVLLVSPYDMSGLTSAFGRLLVLTPRVINLSLNGYLYMALLAVKLKVCETLRSLCLGPTLDFWRTGAFSCEELGPALEKLENLRIVGADICEEEATRIAGEGQSALRRLKRVQWELVETVDPREKPSAPPEAIYDTICRLQGQRQQDSGQTATPHTDSRLIEVRLHPSHLVSVLALAPPHVRAAWLSGSLLRSGDGSAAAPHRVKVVESEAAAASLAGKDGEEAKQRGIRMLHEGSRRWWEECAALEQSKSGKKYGESWMPNASGSLGGEEQH